MYFRDSFESLIHRNESLSNIERFHYLKSALKDEAARALKTLLVSDSNYAAALNTICVRYEDPNELIDYYVNALFSLRAIRRESANKLRELIDDFDNHIRSLQSLEEPVDRWDTILIRLFVEKLDTRTKKEWEKRVSELGRRKTLSDLQAFLEQRYKYLAKTGRPSQAALSTSNRFNAVDSTGPPSLCMLMRASAHSALRIIYYHSARVLRDFRLTVASRR